MSRPSVLRAALLVGLVVMNAALTACGSDANDEEFRQSAFGAVLSFSAAGADDVFVLTDARRTCPTCVTLWQWNSVTGEWARMHDFPKPAEPASGDARPPVEQDALTMAPDALHGWIRWQDDLVMLETDDGGGTWAPAAVPWGRAPVIRMQADPQAVLATVAGDCAPDPCDDLWRTTIRSDSWKLVGPAPAEEPGDGASAATFATDDVAHQLDESGRLLRSEDGGQTWRPITG